MTEPKHVPILVTKPDSWPNESYRIDIPDSKQFSAQCIWLSKKDLSNLAVAIQDKLWEEEVASQSVQVGDVVHVDNGTKRYVVSELELNEETGDWGAWVCPQDAPNDEPKWKRMDKLRKEKTEPSHGYPPLCDS